jgi:hypothetical protein
MYHHSLVKFQNITLHVNPFRSSYVFSCTERETETSYLVGALQGSRAEKESHFIVR